MKGKKYSAEQIVAKLREAENTSEKGKALFYEALAELSQKRLGTAEQLRSQLDESTPESVLLTCASNESTVDR